MDKLSETINLPVDDAVTMAQQVFKDMGLDPMYMNHYNFNALVKNGQPLPVLLASFLPGYLWHACTSIVQWKCAALNVNKSKTS